jgi:hypothetical protein
MWNLKLETPMGKSSNYSVIVVLNCTEENSQTEPPRPWLTEIARAERERIRLWREKGEWMPRKK